MLIRKIQTLRGPNIWANFPVLEAWIDLQEMKDTSSEMIPGFNERLMSWLPSMIEHRCSIGERGGFFERLRRGTYMAHILEHVALELQTLAGNDVGFGRARETYEEEGVYKVALEYREENVGKAAINAGFELIKAAIEGREFDTAGEIKKLKDLVHDLCLGPSTAAIVGAAVSRGIPFRRLNTGSLVQLGYGSRLRRICAAETERTSAIAESIAQDKELTRSLLKSVGVPVPDGQPVNSPEEAWEAAQDIGLPVVVKPREGNHGRGVTTNLMTKEQVYAAFANAKAEEPKVIVEKFIQGADYRLLVIGDKLIAAARRDPAHVIGNGRQSIRELVDEVNKDPRRSDGHATSLSHLKLDAIALTVLADQGFTPDSVPAEGKRVLIRRNANLSTGGTATDVTDELHPDISERAVDAARVIGLDIAGIDLIATDISKPLAETGAAIVEVNAGPGLRMHLDPSFGKPRPVGEAIVDMLFPSNENGRIPIVTVTGTNGKTTTTRMIAHILSLGGRCVGMTCTDGIYIGPRRIDADDCSGPKSARAVLANPRVEAAVFETARGGILREGLAFDFCDVAVVTNIAEGDHLGLNDIQTPERLAQVKRVTVEAVSRNGSAVLNADDPLVAEMAAKCPGSVTYFSTNGDGPLILKRRSEGGRVVFVRDGAIVLADGPTEFPILALDRIPITHGGRIGFQVENAMAATAATWALGVPCEAIRAGLETFAAGIDKSPGRFNLFDLNGVTVVVDYGHNASSLKALVDALANFPQQRRLAVYSTAGDRRDCDMIDQGDVLGRSFDTVVLYEDHYLRGRQPGEIIRLFREGVSRGKRTQDVREVQGWKGAAELALSLAKPGDLLMLQADQVDETLNFLRDLLANQPTSEAREICLKDAASRPAPAAEVR